MAAPKAATDGFEGLGAQWESAVDIRNMARECGLLLKSSDPSNTHIPKTMANLRLNHLVVAFVAERMGRVEALPMPSINILLEEIKEFFQLTRVPVTQQAIYQQAWALRRLTQLLKSLVWKKCAPKELILKAASKHV